MAYPTIENIRQVEFDEGHLWNVKIQDAPAPFNDWFPASDVEIQVGSIDSKESTFYMSSYKIPRNTSSFHITLTYFDTPDLKLTQWFRKWMNEDILNKGEYVTILTESVKQFDFQKLDKNLEEQFSDSYFVYPEGQINIKGSSQSESPQYSITLVIVGSVNA
jgi:hypothetical protein